MVLDKLNTLGRGRFTRKQKDNKFQNLDKRQPASETVFSRDYFPTKVVELRESNPESASIFPRSQRASMKIGKVLGKAQCKRPSGNVLRLKY